MPACINHIEIWVSDLDRSQKFYGKLLEMVGWKKVMDNAWACEHSQLYLREEKSTSRVLSLGVHHLCFGAKDKDTVDLVGKWLVAQKAKIFGGPSGMENYSPGYYTVDFYDPDGMILEVAYNPGMKT